MDNQPQHAKAIGSQPNKKAPKKGAHNPQLRQMMARKKKALPNDIHAQCRQQLQELIAAKEFQAMQLAMCQQPPETLLVMVFAPNDLKSNLLLTCLSDNIGVFFETVNKQLQPIEKHISEYLKEKVVTPELTYKEILRLMVQKYQGKDREFVVWFLQSVVGKKDGLLMQLLVAYFQTEDLMDLVMQVENMVGLIELFQELMVSMGADYTAAALKAGRDQYRLKEGWKTNQFNKEELSVYSLSQLKYNVAHHYATTGDYPRLKQLIVSGSDKHAQLCHELNMSGETPLDIAWRRCPSEQVRELMELILKNPMIRLSTRTLNQVIDNPEVCVIQPLLLQFIQFAKSDDMRNRGYVSQQPLENPNDSCHLVRHLEASGKYPLVKYIENHILPIPDIMKQLLFEQLTSPNNRQLFERMLLVNELRKGQVLEQSRQQLTLLDKFEKEVDEFEKYLLQLYEVAIHSKNQNTVVFLIEQSVYSQLVLCRLSSGGTLHPFLVCRLLEKNMTKAADLLIERLPELTQWKRPDRSTVLPPYQQLKQFRYRLSMLNELAYSASKIPCEKACPLKSFILEQYNRQPQVLQQPILVNRKMHFPINYLHNLLIESELVPIYSDLMGRMAQRLVNQQEKPAHQDWMCKHFRKFYQDTLEHNPMLVSYFRLDPSGELLSNFISYADEPAAVLNIINLSNSTVFQNPEVMDNLKKRVKMSTHRILFCWVKEACDRNLRFFRFILDCFIESEHIKGIELCLNQMIESVSNETCEEFRTQIQKVPKATIVNLDPRIKPVFKSLTDSNLRDCVRNVVLLGSDIIIQGQKHFDFMAYPEKDFWSRITNRMCLSGRSFIQECLELHISEFAAVKNLLEGSSILVLKFYSTMNEFTKVGYFEKKETEEHLIWMARSWGLRQKVVKEIEKLPKMIPPLNEARILEYLNKDYDMVDLNAYLLEYLSTSPLLRRLPLENPKGKPASYYIGTEVGVLAQQISKIIEYRLKEINNENLQLMMRAAYRMLPVVCDWSKLKEQVKARINIDYADSEQETTAGAGPGAAPQLEPRPPTNPEDAAPAAPTELPKNDKLDETMVTLSTNCPDS